MSNGLGILFLLPDSSLTGAFNQMNMNGHACLNYRYGDQKPEDLADFRQVLGGLAFPQVAQGNREVIYARDVKDFVGQESDPRDREAFRMIEGASSIGFNLAILSAVNEKKETTYLYVLEDRTLGKVLVAGSESITPAAVKKLRKNGVEYTIKSDPGAVSAINDFVAEGIRKRDKKGTLPPGTTQDVTGHLIKAFVAICDVSANGANRATLGDVIHSSTAKPSVYSGITKPVQR